MNVKSLEFFADSGLNQFEVGSKGVTAIRVLRIPTETESLEYEWDAISNGREYKNQCGTYCGQSYCFVDESGEIHASDYFLYQTQGTRYEFVHMGATYSPDCPACLRHLQHSMAEHKSALSRKEG